MKENDIMLDINNYKKLNFPYTISLNRYLGRSGNRVYKKKEALEYIEKINEILKENNIIYTDKFLKVFIIQHPIKLKKYDKNDKFAHLKQRRQDLDNINKVLLDSLQVDKNEYKMFKSYGDNYTGFNKNKLYFDDKQIIELTLKVGEPVENGGISFYYKEVDLWVMKLKKS